MNEGKLQDAIKCLSIPISRRSASDIITIVKSLENEKFFQTLLSKNGREALTECCRVLSLSIYSPGEVIFNHGDTGDSFCIILKGRVSVLVPTEDDGLEESVKLSSGACFGEVSLMTGCPRTATVKCVENTMVASLSSKKYNKLVRSYQKEDIKEKVAFLKQISPFNHWSKKQITDLALFFTFKKIYRNSFVYREGDPSDMVYIIKKGEFKTMHKESFIDKLKRKTDVKELQVVIKQEKEIFGFEDVIENKYLRDLSCQCTSIEGELLTISAREFRRRINNPESLSVLNSRTDIMSSWTKHRIEGLKTVEKFKHKNQFSPTYNHKVPQQSVTPSSNIRKEFKIATASPRITHSSQSKRFRTKKSHTSRFFVTESGKPTYNVPDVQHIRKILSSYQPSRLKSARRSLNKQFLK